MCTRGQLKYSPNHYSPTHKLDVATTQVLRLYTSQIVLGLTR
jgi:hypothetical protein